MNYPTSRLTHIATLRDHLIILAILAFAVALRFAIIPLNYAAPDRTINVNRPAAPEYIEHSIVGSDGATKTPISEE